MFKKVRIHIILCLVAIVWIVYADSVRKKPINWFSSFHQNHKIPYGTYVLRNSLPDLLPNTKIYEVNESPYTKLKDTTLTGTYFFLDNAINFGKEEFNQLLKFVDRGNDIFISTYGAFVDTLNLKTNLINTLDINEIVKLNLVNENLDTTSFSFKNDVKKIGFKSIDSTKTEVLGKIRVENKGGKLKEERINFIRQKFGKGYFYFHLQPHAFTNYYMLKDDTNLYVASMLSYINEKKPLYWDSYYKTGKSRISTPMYYVLNSKSLKWAYYTALIGLLLFVLFQGKRNQRYIPVIKPLQNQTVAFAKTISNLYFDKKEHKAIVEKSIFYFKNYIRQQFSIPTEVLNESFYEHLASRSGNNLEDIQKLFKKIKEIQTYKNCSKEQLKELNTMIESFKKNYQTA